MPRAFRPLVSEINVPYSDAVTGSRIVSSPLTLGKRCDELTAFPDGYASRWYLFDHPTKKRREAWGYDKIETKVGRWEGLHRGLCEEMTNYFKYKSKNPDTHEQQCTRDENLSLSILSRRRISTNFLSSRTGRKVR